MSLNPEIIPYHECLADALLGSLIGAEKLGRCSICVTQVPPLVGKETLETDTHCDHYSALPHREPAQR